MESITIQVTEQTPLRMIGTEEIVDPTIMKFEDFKKIINKIKNPHSITIVGGEPFCHKDIVKIVKYCFAKKIKPKIETSGSANLNLLRQVKPYIELVRVHIKYLNDKLDSRWRGAKNSFTRAKKFLEKARELEIPVEVVWVADNQNFTELYLLQQFVSAYYATLVVTRFIPEKELMVFCLNDDNWEELCKHASKFQNVRIEFPSNYTYQFCVGGVSRFHIKADGTITPCIYSKDEIANAYKDPFLDIVKKGCEWRLLHKTHYHKVIKGCVGLLKEVNADLNQKKDMEFKILQLMQTGRGVMR